MIRSHLAMPGALYEVERSMTAGRAFTCTCGLAWVALAALGCSMPDFAKVDSNTLADSGVPAAEDGGPDGPLACQVDLNLGAACKACVAEHCCEQASACADGACGPDIRLPISPATRVTEAFDSLMECMQAECDGPDSCDVSWGCVDRYRLPQLEQDHRFEMRVFNFADPDETGLPGVNVRLCEASDPSCMSSDFMSEAQTDDQGIASFVAEPGFSGYFVLNGGGPVPGVLLWNVPVYTIVDRFEHQAFPPGAVDALAVVTRLHSEAGQPFAPNTGHLIMRVQTCLPLRYLDHVNARAKDVRLTFTPNQGASRVYYVNDLGTVDLQLDATSARGYAGAFEVPVTNVRVTATLARTGKQVATGVIPVRDGSIGYMYLMPNVSH
jgi:hypothetical protein